MTPGLLQLDPDLVFDAPGRVLLVNGVALERCRSDMGADSFDVVLSAPLGRTEPNYPPTCRQSRATVPDCVAGRPLVDRATGPLHEHDQQVCAFAVTRSGCWTRVMFRKGSRADLLNGRTLKLQKPRSQIDSQARLGRLD